MNKTIAFVLSSAFLVPVFVFAQAQVPVTQQPAAQVPVTQQNTPQAPVTQQTSASGGIQNPLKGVSSLAGLFYKLANFVYSLSYAVIAFFLIWSGFKFVAAQGNDTKLQDAKRTFYYTIIGAVLLIGAQVITEVVRNLINQFTNNPI